MDLVLDGGPCRVGVESTILSLAGDPPVILRPGGVPREALEEALGVPLDVAGRGRAAARPGAAPRSTTPRARRCGPARDRPGPPREGRVGLLAWRAAPARRLRRGRGAVPGRLAGDGRGAASSPPCAGSTPPGLDLILAEPCDEAGLGHAIMDRLRRAAAPRLRPARPARPRAASIVSRTQASTSAGSDVKRTATDPSPETCTTLA